MPSQGKVAQKYVEVCSHASLHEHNLHTLCVPTVRVLLLLRGERADAPEAM